MALDMASQMRAYPTPATTPPEQDDPTGPITVLASSRAVVAGRLTPATIVISLTTGKIVSVVEAVVDRAQFPPGTRYVDHTPHVLMPGLVDAHVHLNEPGRTEWEGFWTGTRAAAFGGVTTVIDMPLNAIPPTTTVAGLREKVAAAQGKCWVDVGFYGGLIPGNEDELKGLVQGGVRGFKGFLIDSGVAEFPAVSSIDVAKAMAVLKDEPTTLMFHAEMLPPISDSVGDAVQASLPPLSPAGPLNAYDTFLKSRPPAFETYAISEIISLAHLAPSLPLHIVHLSAVEAIPLLRAARRSGVKITAETCFHYLALAAEAVQEGDTRHKCCPPIRAQANQDGLWHELTAFAGPRYDPEASVIQTVVSDHSPCTPALKLLPARISSTPDHPATATTTDPDPSTSGDFFAAWGGISSVGLGLPILWTESLRRPGLAVTLPDIARWCSANTAAQIGLAHRKGELAVGKDGDVAVFDDVAEWVVGREAMLFRNKCSAYEGRRLRGVVKESWVRGRRVFIRGDGAEAGGTLGVFDERGGPVGELLLEVRGGKKE